MARHSAVNPHRPTQRARAGANPSRRALVTCVSSSAPPYGAREEGGCGSPGTVPGVRWPNLATPIRLLLSSIIQPKCRQRGSRLGSCGVDREAQARRCGYDFQSSAANFITKPMGPNASNTRTGSSVAAGSLHVSISVIQSSPAPACPTKASASRL